MGQSVLLQVANASLNDAFSGGNKAKQAEVLTGRSRSGTETANSQGATAERANVYSTRIHAGTWPRSIGRPTVACATPVMYGRSASRKSREPASSHTR